MDCRSSIHCAWFFFGFPLFLSFFFPRDLHYHSAEESASWTNAMLPPVTTRKKERFCRTGMAHFLRLIYTTNIDRMSSSPMSNATKPLESFFFFFFLSFFQRFPMAHNLFTHPPLMPIYHPARNQLLSFKPRYTSRPKSWWNGDLYF